jgi:hypothetical protein
MRISRAAAVAVVLAGTLGLGMAPGAAASAPHGVAPGTAASALPAVSAPPASAPPTVSAGTLVRAYVSGRHLPAGSVAGIRAGSLRTTSAAGVNWAIADFTPSASATAGVQADFQDGASTGIFTETPGQPWQLIRTGPPACGRGLPAGLGQVICQAAISTQRSAASAALTQAGAPAASQAASQAGSAGALGQSIARIALGQVGVGDAPAVTGFGGVDCDPYSALVGALSPNADGCGYNTGLGVADENEDWCSDFAKWVWQHAGVTTDMSALNAGAASFYGWGLGQHETMPADGGTPAAGDAVVFFPPGRISASYADHVGIVTAVNPGGTVNLVNGDFLGTSNITVQYATKVSLTSWAAQIWGPGEQWVLVGPPAGVQPPAPAATISGPHVAVTGTAASFSASGTVPGGSVTQYQWTFGDGRTANQAGSHVSTVFPGSGSYPVTMTATSSRGTSLTRTWNVDVIGASSAVTSVPSDAVWYSTTPVGQYLFLPTPAGGLAVETSEGSGWLQQAIPGSPSGGVTALAYPDPAADDAMTPHAYFRSSGGTLAQTYLGGAGWTTQPLAGQPEQGSALAATTQAGQDPQGPAVFYFNAAGQLSETAAKGTSWVTSTLAGPATSDAGSLTLADTASGPQVFYLAAPGTLTVASGSGRPTAISSPYGVAADSPLSAITTRSGQASVFFTDQRGKLAEATQAAKGWTVAELPGTTVPTALAALNSPDQEVFSVTGGGQPAVTAWNGQQWQTTALPGPATGIEAVSAYPDQELFLADGTGLSLDQGTAPGAAWTATTLPDSAATLADRVLLYAATSADDTSAVRAASAAGLPATAVTESFGTAWAATLSGNYLVIAVGPAAVDALYYNTCGWANPSGDGAGGTPFSLAGEPLNRLPAADSYEDAAAATAGQTPALAADLAYYASHGALPGGVTKLPSQAGPRRACAGES